MNIYKINVTLVILTCLIVLSVGFFVSAQDSSNNANIFLDSDQDGLSDAEEKTWGTDPANKDTDHDGYSDGAEVKSGYDPKKPAPGDKLIAEKASEVAGESTEAPSENNLTQQVAQKISELTAKTSVEDQEVSLDEVKSIIDESLNTESQTLTLPEIDKNSIKIKKQNYKKLSKEEAEKRKKEDFSRYIAGMFYILSSNSPKPITSMQDITSVTSEITGQILQAISKQDLSALTDLEKSSDKMLEQIRDIEVPEEVVDIHVKALQYATYTKELKKTISQSSKDDPLGDIVSYSKVEGLIQSIVSFSLEAEQKFSQYGLAFDDTMAQAFKSVGIDPEKNKELLEEISK